MRESDPLLKYTFGTHVLKKKRELRGNTLVVTKHISFHVRYDRVVVARTKAAGNVDCLVDIEGKWLCTFFFV